MIRRTKFRARPALALSCALAGLVALAAGDAPQHGKDGPLLLIDGGGKEQKLTAWRFTVGTRHLTWLAEHKPAEPKPEPKPAEPPPKGKAPAKAPVAKGKPAIGPEALEFREEQSTNWADGIITLVPLDRIRALEYDDAKQTVTLKVATADKDKDEVLTGSTKYKGVNKLTIEAEVDKGDMGIAEVKFLAGTAKGIRGLTFPKPQAPNGALMGRPAAITVLDKMKFTQKATDLTPLYRLPDGTERALPALMFKKTLKVDLAKVNKIHAVEGPASMETEWVVTFKNGEEQTLTLLKTMMIDDKPATLEGFVGRTAFGYRIYPPHTVGDIVFDEAVKSE